MAQTSSLSIGSGLSGLAFRNANNTNLAALFSSNSGSTAPPVTVGGMFWHDTSVAPPVLRWRNIANTAWIEVGSESVPAGTLRGNDSGVADVERNLTAASVRTMLGFPTATVGVGYWGTQYAGTGLNFVLPSGGSVAFILFKRGGAGPSVIDVTAGVLAGGSIASAGTAGFDIIGLCWRIA